MQSPPLSPICVIITGRPASGKTTLSKELAEKLHLPIISRDAIKEGFTNTIGIKHDKLPTNTNAMVSKLFFEIVHLYLAHNVSVIIEAAFQHHVWESQMARIVEQGRPFLIICTIDEETAVKRYQQRTLTDSTWTFYHGRTPPPSQYIPPNFNLPTIHVSTENKYTPDLDEITKHIQSQYTR